MQTTRYCGHCLQENGPEIAECRHCGSPLPDDARRDGAGDGVAKNVALGAQEETVSKIDEGTPVARSESSADGVASVDDGVSAGDVAETIGAYKTVSLANDDEVAQRWGVGQRVAGRFVLSHCIGQGGMGKVFLAKDDILGRQIALKRVPQDIIFDSDARDDLRQEANRLLDLAHENIVRVHTYYDEPDWPFFAMEYLRGPTLKKLLNVRKNEKRRFSFDEVRIISRQVGRGLAYAHKKNVIHRDLKPANLMMVDSPGEEITENDVIKITDFGISRVVADSTLRQTGKRSGTLPYMSPEQFRGEECTVESDVYSLAATYYELLSGRPPFFTGDIAYQIVNVTPKPLDNVPRGVNGVLLRALSKNPERRYHSVEEFTSALEQRRLPDIVSITAVVRRFALRAAVVLLGIVVLGLAALGVQSLFPKSTDREVHQNVVSNASSSIDRHAFAKELRQQLQVGIPYKTNNTTLEFHLRKEGELGKDPDVFSGISFELDPERQAEARIIHGVALPGGDELKFVLNNLSEGPHYIRVRLQPVAQEIVDLPETSEISRGFEIDVAGPNFTIEPLRKKAFVQVPDTKSPDYATFQDTCIFKLATLEAGDIHSAFYQLVSPDGKGNLETRGAARFPIHDHQQWTLPLVEGRNSFLVYAKDNFGNESSPTKLEITRLQLAVHQFERVRETARGTRVEVQGVLNVEGTVVPDIHFFLNDSHVSDPQQARGQLSRESPSFRTTLTLPRFRNKIEVRYEWGGEIFPFSPPAIIPDVEVVAPHIVLLPEPPNRTKEDSVRLVGIVRPYFPGLTLTLFHKKVGTWSLTLRPDESNGPDAAEFRRDVYLSPNALNEFQFVPEYDGEVLASNLPPFTIYCDTTDPDLEDVNFDPKGMNLHIRLTPSESLSLLRIREADQENWATEFVMPNGDYLRITELPAAPTTFTVEMTDLVGNVNEVTRRCQMFDLTSVEESPSSFKGETEELVAVLSREEADAILKMLGITFKEYGKDGESMMTTELPERALNTYLSESQIRPDIGEGSLQLPAVVGETFDGAQVVGFVTWLNEKVNDGFEYYIPTADQWRASFMNSEDPGNAVRDIEDWFQGRHPTWSFDPFPNVNYGKNKVSPIGSRKENMTMSGLLDMESNLQEIVRGKDSSWLVIGGWNTLRPIMLRTKCTHERHLKASLNGYEHKYTGLRLGRRPKQ